MKGLCHKELKLKRIKGFANHLRRVVFFDKQASPVSYYVALGVIEHQSERLESLKGSM